MHTNNVYNLFRLWMVFSGDVKVNILTLNSMRIGSNRKICRNVPIIGIPQFEFRQNLEIHEDLTHLFVAITVFVYRPTMHDK